MFGTARATWALTAPYIKKVKNGGVPFLRFNGCVEFHLETKACFISVTFLCPRVFVVLSFPGHGYADFGPGYSMVLVTVLSFT
jgi:hypothetical protein